MWDFLSSLEFLNLSLAFPNLLVLTVLRLEKGRLTFFKLFHENTPHATLDETIGGRNDFAVGSSKQKE